MEVRSWKGWQPLRNGTSWRQDDECEGCGDMAETTFWRSSRKDETV